MIIPNIWQLVSEKYVFFYNIYSIFFLHPSPPSLAKKKSGQFYILFILGESEVLVYFSNWHGKENMQWLLTHPGANINRFCSSRELSSTLFVILSFTLNIANLNLDCWQGHWVGCGVVLQGQGLLLAGGHVQLQRLLSHQPFRFKHKNTTLQ